MTTDNARKPLIDYWVSDERGLGIPTGQSDVKRRWKGSVMLMDGQGVVSEYDLLPQSKLRLTEMLDIIMQKMHLLSSGDTADCGFKIW